jgi:hypothetical protein
LSLAPTVGLGIGRFGDALVLPDTRDSPHWSYSAAGFMNTINAAGYLAGALLASRLFRRFGWSATVHGGTLASAASRAVRDHRSFSSCSAWRASLQGSAPLPVSSRAARPAARIAKVTPRAGEFPVEPFSAGPGLA